MWKRVLIYGASGGVLIAFLKYIEYQHFVHTYPAELYGGVVAVIFTVIGVVVGSKWMRPREDAVIREVVVQAPAEFVRDDDALTRSGLTPRELEILGLIAEGLSNRDIGERVFVSESTVKTHSYRLFQKLGVRRRTQAVQRGKELRLIP